MTREQLTADIAALRDTLTLEEVIELVVTGLGGAEKVTAELEALDDDLPGDDADDGETPDPLIVMRDADVAKLEKIQGMAEAFCGWLHAKGARQMEKDTDEAADTVRQLSASFSKAARAVRLSMVLKHEVAGLRPLPNARPAAAVNENSPAVPMARTGRRPGPRTESAGHREETEIERREREADERLLYLATLLDAFKEDTANAPPEIQAEAKRQSPVVKLTTIAASIPHPSLDRRLADIHLGRLWDAVAPRNATKPAALAPPTWEEISRRWDDDDRRRYGRVKGPHRS